MPSASALVDIVNTGANRPSDGLLRNRAEEINDDAFRFGNLKAVVLAIALAAIAAGVIFRFSSLDTKLFWQDEAISALRITGHTVADLNALFNNRTHTASDVQSLQQVAPGHGLDATWSSLVREEPQRSLPYFLSARLWVGAFGTTATNIRAFSAVIGVLGIFLAFALGRAATRSVRGGVILAALIAVSPFQVRYSQEAREYILFADCVLLSTWLLLRALDHPSARSWVGVAASAVLGLYVDPEFILVIAGFAIVVGLERPWRRMVQGGFTAAALAAALAFAPWAIINLQAAHGTEAGVAWAATPYSPFAFALKWIFNIGATLFDAELADRRWSIMLLPLACLVAYAATVVVHNARGGCHVSRLAVALASCTALPLIALDVIKRSHFEAVIRYQVSTWLGIEIIVMLGIMALLGSSDRRKAVVGILAIGYVAACGTFSNIVSARYPIWWDNNQPLSEAAVAHAIPTNVIPTIIVQRGHSVSALVLSRYLQPEGRLLMLNSVPSRLKTTERPYYAFLPSMSLLQALSKEYRLVNVSPDAGSIVPQLARDSTDSRSQARSSLWRVDSQIQTSLRNSWITGLF